MGKNTKVVSPLLLLSLNGRDLIFSPVSRQFQESWRHSLGEKDSFTSIVYIFYIHPPMNTQRRYLEYMYTSRSSLMFVGNGNADSHKWERTQSKGLTSSRQTLLKAFRFTPLSPLYHRHPFLLALLSHGTCAALKAHNTMSLAEYNILEVFDRRYQSGQLHLYQSCFSPTDFAFSFEPVLSLLASL